MAGVDEQEGASGCSCTLRSLSLFLFLRRNQMTEVAWKIFHQMFRCVCSKKCLERENQFY